MDTIVLGFLLEVLVSLHFSLSFRENDKVLLSRPSRPLCLNSELSAMYVCMYVSIYMCVNY